MKKYILSAAILGLLFLFSCEKEDGRVLEIVSTPELEALTDNNFVLNDETSSDTVIVFKWSEAEYNIPVQIDYVLLADAAGGDFSDAVEIGTTAADTFAITVFELNKLMTRDFGLAIGEEGTITFKVASKVGESDLDMSSAALDVAATTYDPPYTPETFKILVDGTEAKTLNLLDGMVDEEGWYEGYIRIDNADAEITLQGGDEDAFTYGIDGAGSGSPIVEYTLAKDGAAVTVDSVGYWRFRFNMYSQELNVMGTFWGVIGSAIPPYDWSISQDMTYDAANDVWTIEVETNAAEFKFRPNNTWDPLNYGDDEADGVPEEYGANIPVDAGTKIITLDLSEFPYSYTVGNAK